MMNKSIALLLICILLFTFLVSCDRKYDEAEVLTEAEKLLKEASVLNGIYYGRGIDYLSGGYINGYYSEASPYHLESLGISTVDELKKKTEKVFSDRYCLNLYDVMLDGVYDESGEIVYMSRYYQKYEDDLPTGAPECIMVYTKYEPLFTSTVVYDYTTLKVVDVKKETLYLTVEVEVTSEEGESQQSLIEFSLIEEEDGWRLDSSTFVNYNPHKTN